MIKLEKLIIGAGVSAGVFSRMAPQSHTAIIDASTQTHSQSAFDRLRFGSRGGNRDHWGGNLFFDADTCAQVPQDRLAYALDLMKLDLHGERYDTDFGFGYLMPKRFYPEPVHPILQDTITRVDPDGSGFVAKGQHATYRCENLAILTGASCMLSPDGAGLVFKPATVNEGHDKILTVKFSDVDHGLVSMDSVSENLFVQRFRLKNYGLDGVAAGDLVRLIHLLNGQLPLKKMRLNPVFKLIVPVINRLRKRPRDNFMYLSAYSHPIPGGNALQLAGSKSTITDPNFAEPWGYGDTAGLFRALHTEIFQDPSVIQRLDDLGIVHDQFGQGELGSRFGSVGHRLLRALTRGDYAI